MEIEGVAGYIAQKYYDVLLLDTLKLLPHMYADFYLSPYKNKSASTAKRVNYYIGEKNDLKIFLKIIKPHSGDNFLGIIYELYVYDFLKKNFHRYINLKNYVISLHDIKYIKIDNEEIYFITTEYSHKNKYLFDFLIEKINCNDYDSFTAVIFDLLYGIYVLNEEIGLVHNDLHFHNILYVPTTDYVQICNINNEHVKIQKAFFIKIFDFDNATLYDDLHNLFLDKDMDRLFGSCNKKTKKDIHTLVTCLYYFRRVAQNNVIFYERIEQIINIIMPNERLLNYISLHLDNDKSPFSWSKYGIFQVSEYYVINDTAIYDDIDIKSIIKNYFDVFIEQN